MPQNGKGPLPGFVVAALERYAAAGIVLLTAVPAGGVPVVSAGWMYAFAAEAKNARPDAPWWAWALVLLIFVVMPLAASLASIYVFGRTVACVRRLPRGQQWLSLGRGAWQALLACGFGLGIAGGAAGLYVLME